jgi:hypothetical protein
MPIMNDKVKWSDFNRRLFAKWPQTNDGHYLRCKKSC